MNDVDSTEKRKKRLKIYYSLLITVVCIIGVSYAWFKLYLSQSEDNTLASRTCFSTTLTEDTSKIELTDVFPIVDTEGLKQTPFTFTVKNNCSGYAKMYITINSTYRASMDSAYLSDDYVKVNVSPAGTTDNESVILGKQSLTDLENNDKGYIIIETGLKANEEKSYDLRVWMDAAVTVDQGLDKLWAGKIVIVSSASEEPAPAPNGWYEADDGTLLAALRRDNKLSSPLTISSKEITLYTGKDLTSGITRDVSTTYQSYYWTYGTGWEANGAKFNLTGVSLTSDTYSSSYKELIGKYVVSSWAGDNGDSTKTLKETTGLYNVYYIINATESSYEVASVDSNKNITEAVMASSEDDYGISYYFRGSVKNNYVEFANKCWKVVRITGDGSVKLVLHNDNTSSVSNPCAKANYSATAAFARYDGNTYATSFNIKNNDNAYVGFMYGTTGASDYATTHANINKSVILANLETWYKNNMTSYSDKLADVIWCNDKSTSSGTGIGTTNNVVYGSNSRVYSDYEPSFICPNDNDGGKLSKFTVDDTELGNGMLTYKAGLLTADEVAFAGGAYMYFNYGSYLIENTDTKWWWTMSPSKYVGSNAYVWNSPYGSLQHYEVTYTDDNLSGGLRPAVALKSSTTISGGNGTSENPYVIN